MKTFFGRHEGKLETFAKICVAASLDTLREDPTVCTLQKSCDKQAIMVWMKSLEPLLCVCVLKSDHSIISALNSKGQVCLLMKFKY